MANDEQSSVFRIEVQPALIVEGGEVSVVLTNLTTSWNYDVQVVDSGGNTTKEINTVGATGSGAHRLVVETSGLVAGQYYAQARVQTKQNNSPWVKAPFLIVGRANQVSADVTLHRSASHPTRDQALWVAIRNRTGAIGYSRYQKLIDCVFGCVASNQIEGQSATRTEQAAKEQAVRLGDSCPKLFHVRQPLSIHGPSAYVILKFATQVFLTLETGVVIRDEYWNGHKLFDQDEEARRLNETQVTADSLNERLKQYLGGEATQLVLPYLNRIVEALLALSPAKDKEVLPYCYGILQHRFTQPSLLELIWSYWHEEGMLAQTMNAIALRFQNQRLGPNDPLGELEIDPLRPLNNLIWGYVQDEHNRLTVRRRAYEYDHHYGLKLRGRAVPELESADSRSKFIEAFHNLLYRTAVFYREDADTTVSADAFPLLNALKDVHLLLAEGAHNQYGDLPWTARAEMLTQQWILARPEMREFLRGRHMVPYQEPWMGAVDAMKKLQGWTDTTITHFNELAVDGERLLLSIRFGDWSDLNNTEEQSKNWARYWKPEIQRYLYGYLAITGVDLMADITDNREAATRYLQPSMLLQRRLMAQKATRVLPAARGRPMLQARTGGTAVSAPGQGPRALRYKEGE